MNDDKNTGDKGRLYSFESFGLLAGGLAHDYNNMLTAMLGNIELILCDNIPESTRETATDIKATMLKAATLVKRMLSYASGAEPQNERIDFNLLVRDIVRIMKRSIPENVVVNIEQSQKIPVVFADTTMFWQVMMNLVINACDALESKPGLLKIAVRSLSLSSADIALYKGDSLEPGDYVEISVSDTGCGISEETREHIFEPLFTTKRKGNGLGLPSIMSVLEIYKGGLKAESEIGKGTTFRIVVPALHNADGSLVYPEGVAVAPSLATLASPPRCIWDPPANGDSADAAAGAKSVSSSAAQSSAAVTEKKTILVVDDDPSIVKLLKIILEKSNRYDVITALNGNQGLEVYRANSSVIDLCLIDASMGAGMNGLDLCAAIRRESANLPLILMSAYRAKEMSARMAVSGVTTFLAKPFRGADVIELCAKYVG